MEELPLIDFTKVKKKRPQKNKVLEKFTEENDLSEFIVKKGPKKETQDEDKENINTANTDLNEEEYTYDNLYDRITFLIKKFNPVMADTTRAKLSIPIPIINRVGTSRSAWINFSEVCNSLNRPTDHLYQFVLSGLGVEGSLGGECQFLLKGRFNNKHIESLLKKYVHDYVQCPVCKSSATVLKKDNSARLQVLYCTACQSERTVSAIKAGLQKKK